MGKPWAHDVYRVQVPTDREMDDWNRQIIEQLAAGDTRVSAKRLKVLAARYQRDDAYRVIQRTWHRRLSKLFFTLFLISILGGFLIAGLITDYLVGTARFAYTWATFITFWLPVILFFVGYLITGLIAAQARGFEAFLFRKRLLWIEDYQRALALSEEDLNQGSMRLANDFRIQWVWRFW